jgi:tight adherence protein B
MSLLLMMLIALAVFIAVGCAVLLFHESLRIALRLWVERFHLDMGERLGEQFFTFNVARGLQFHALFVIVLALLFGVFTAQWLVALLVGALAAVTPVVASRVLISRRLRRLASQWPDALGLIGAGLKSGASLSQAMTQACRELPAPCGQELALCLREQRMGVPLETALLRLSDRAPSEGLSLFVAAVRISQETGGQLAETLDRLSQTLRRKAALEGRIDALTAQGRLQGWVMVALPLAVGAALFLIEPQAMQALFTTWPGRFLVVVIALLEACGLHFIRRITQVEV